MDPANGLIAPGADPVTVDINVSVHCEPPSVTVLPFEIDHRLEITSDEVSGSLSKASHEITSEMQGCVALPVTVEYTVEATLVFSAKVPAYEDVGFRFYTTINGNEELAVEWTQTSDLRGTFVADAYPTTLRVERGMPEKSELQIINRANTPLDISIVLEVPPENGNLDFPSTLTVPYTPGGLPAVTPFTIEYAREQAGTDQFTLLISGSPAERPEEQLPSSTLEFRVEDLDGGRTTGESPSIPIGLTIIAVIGGLWGTIRRDSCTHKEAEDP